MSKPLVICIDDQRDILAALQKDLFVLDEHLQIEYCESTDEAKELIEEQDANGNLTALIICDHVMPGQSGIDFLIELHKDQRFSSIPSIVLTGLATHQDTITAINQASIQAYIEKPWDKNDLLRFSKKAVTRSILQSGLDYHDYLPILDSEILLLELHKQT